MIGRVQYISQSNAQGDHLDHIQRIVESGGDWVQLRVKDRSEAEVKELAIQAKELCSKTGTQLIINDFPHIAAEVKADGVHLGKNDLAPKLAREMVGPDMIIGGTANTFEDIEYLADQGVNYIGLGPFRFTTTKKNLSPVLGHEGYRNLISQARDRGIHIPIIAIGGILLEDVPELMKTGIHGIALSGLITHAESPSALISQLQTLTQDETVGNRR
ncbi:thiamine phosphate synthase [Pontibacter sp. G13]|uniref:thiamine phosphate synthase n=1 Tax=Pontibacter sp. G13 TaxID=3074898 RepID=UPI00288A59F7|nr:thiamine phosphate synthase [Pontibacter sp. G13]WNJ18969.1 thiamine phosphate synthase [Pontibacter sp. G13]